MKEILYIAINYKNRTTEAVSLFRNGDIKDLITTDSFVEYKEWLEEQKSHGYEIKFITLGKVQLMAETLNVELDEKQLVEIHNLVATYFELEDKLKEGRVKYTPSMRSPITWYGGKANMAKDIIPLFPPKFDTYVEAFGGAGSILFKKSPSKFEIYNDIHSGLYNFFTVLKDKELSAELIDSLILTPYSRYEFEQSKISLSTDDEVEKARKFYVNIMQSFGSMGKNFSTSTSVSRGGCAQCVNAYLGHVNDLEVCSKRLENVTIKNEDALELIGEYDNPKTLFYCDLPYLHETRAKSARNTYKHEMTDNMHERFIERMATVKGYVMISGYRSELYNRLLDYGFKEIVLGTYTERSSSSSTKGKRVEMLWANFDADTGRKIRNNNILKELTES